MLLQFLAYFILLYLLLPRLVVRFNGGETGWLERVFITLIHSTLFFIVIVEFLAFIKLYETISIIAVTFLTAAAADRLVNGNKSLLTSVIVKLYDLTDDPQKNIPAWLKGIAASKLEKMKDRARGAWAGLRRHWFAAILICGTLAYGAYVRFYHSVTHYYFGFADPYVHMSIAKNLSSNRIFEDVYPPGFGAVISAIQTFFIVDPYIVVRYIGPLSGMLMVLSIAFAIRKLVGNYPVLIFSAMALYVFYSGLPSFTQRQIAALSMEYAAIFLLPGIAFMIEYFRKKRFSDLMLAGECLAITVLIHVYVAVTLAMAFLVIFAVHWRSLLDRKTFFRVAKVVGISGAAASLPQIYALLTVKSYTLEYTTGNIQGFRDVPFSEWHAVFFNEDIGVLILIALGAAALAALLARLPFARIDEVRRSFLKAIASILSIYLVSYIVFRSGAYGLPTAIPQDRFGVFFALIASLTAGIILFFMISPIRRPAWRRAAETFLSVLLVAAVLATGRINTANAGDRYQYDDSVRMYLHIKEHFPLLNWTIVSPQEENHLVIGYGWHYQLWEFVKALEFPEAEESNLKFETPYVFFYVEKIPLPMPYEPSPYDGPVTEGEANAPFPLYDGQLTTEFYYRSDTNRRILEAKIFKWAEEYRQKHDNMTIYYDSPEFRVYLAYSEQGHNFLR